MRIFWAGLFLVSIGLIWLAIDSNNVISGVFAGAAFGQAYVKLTDLLGRPR